MDRRLKVLISAFACRPGRGSEPEVGWQWALGMAHLHDVTVLTQLKHQAAIEAGLAALPPGDPRPKFRYFEGGPTMARLRKRLRAVRLFYVWWQSAAWTVVEELHAEIGFDLLHHVTFAGYRYTTAIWGHGVPSIWGPVGGMESLPYRLLPFDHFFALISEVGRNLSNTLQALPFHVLPRRAADSTVVLVSTVETQRVFEALGARPMLMPTIGVEADVISSRFLDAPVGPLELLFVGQIISLKGVDLAIRALAASGTTARLTFIGSGNYVTKAQRLARHLGMQSRVLFTGRVPRAEVLDQYDKYHVFMFPSLHDSGGFAVLEAMARGLPVICLDCGGPAISVREGCGIRVSLGSRREVVQDLAGAIRAYDQDRRRVAQDGERARKSVAEHYDWERKCEELDQVYREATKEPERRRAAARQKGFLPSSRHLVFTMRGVILSILVILMIAWVEVESIGQLKNAAARIVTDRLPSLSMAAMANESRNNSFIKTLLFLDTASATSEPRYLAEIERLSQDTTLALERYEEILSDRIDRENFQKLKKARVTYLAVRGQVLHDFSLGRRDVARLNFERALLPTFEAYATASEMITTYNIEAGKRDGEEILRLTRITQWTLAGLGVAIFAVGFILGVSKT